MAYQCLLLISKVSSMPEGASYSMQLSRYGIDNFEAASLLTSSSNAQERNAGLQIFGPRTNEVICVGLVDN